MLESPEELRRLIRSALDRTAGSVDGLASELGVSYHTLWGWKAGRRTPNPRALRQFAEALEQRSHDLEQIAGRLREAAEDMDEEARRRAVRTRARR